MGRPGSEYWRGPRGEVWRRKGVVAGGSLKILLVVELVEFSSISKCGSGRRRQCLGKVFFAGLIFKLIFVMVVENTGIEICKSEVATKRRHVLLVDSKQILST